MRVSEPRRTLPRLAATLLLSAAVAVVSIPAVQSAAPSRPVAREAPADLYRSQQWTLGALHIPRSWRYSRGNGVTVAVLDTGVDGHQADLSGRVIDGPDFTGHLRKPGGRYWGRHGTSMASIIAAHGHGTGGAAGVMGVAPDAKILSIRVTWETNDPARADHAQTDNSRDSIAQGIRYATDHGAQVISMSLGGGKLFYDGNPLEEAAIKYAQSKGVVLVASAGNDGNGANRRNYPAAYPGVIAVGAVDRADRPAKFTNRHTYVSVAAPGVEIVSADVAGHGYILGTGTSSSAAFVAGMSALVKARYPALSPAEVKQALEEGASHRPPDGRSTKIGTGVADALGTLIMAAHINKAEHAGTPVQAPGSADDTAPPAKRNGPDLMLIAVLSGGGTLLVLSLILGWRQRRRRPLEDEDEEEETPPPPPRSRARSTGTSFEARSEPPERLSPWEPRPATDDLSPWESRQEDSTADVSPWEPRTRDTPPADVPSMRESPAEASTWGESEMTPWADPFAEARPREPGSPESPRGRHSAKPTPETSWDPRAAGPRSADPPSDPRLADPRSEPSWDRHSAAPQPETSWDRHSGEAPSESWERQQAAPPSDASWEPAAETPSWAEEPEPATTQDVRVAGGLDPLSDGPIDSTDDVGTPLADESWESIRRGFDRLKEDARNWESIATPDIGEPQGDSSRDALDETVNMPVVSDDDGKNHPPA